MSDLLPCPFCGGKAAAYHSDDYENPIFCMCESCAAQVPWSPMASATAAWNRRARPASGEREGEESELSEKDLAMIDWAWETHKAAAPAPSPPSQASEIERLTRERDEWRVAAEHWNEERKLRERAYDHFDKVELTRKLEAAGARVKELEAVLEWYADLNNYVPPKPYLDKPIAHDNGDRARAVLGVEMK